MLKNSSVNLLHPPRLDKSAVRKSFNRSAARYDQSAVLQAEVLERLLERLEAEPFLPAVWLRHQRRDGRRRPTHHPATEENSDHRHRRAGRQDGLVRLAVEQVQRIVEQRDASPDELDVAEVCTSIYAFRRDLLGPALRTLTTDNAQGEFYLTDIVRLAAESFDQLAPRQARRQMIRAEEVRITDTRHFPGRLAHRNAGQACHGQCR